MRAFSYHKRHSFSCLLDQKFDVHIDDESKTVTIFAKTFDSHLISRVLVEELPAEGVVAFLDDNTRCEHALCPLYALKIIVGDGSGSLFSARVVRLSNAVHKGADLAITLETNTRGV